MSDYFSKQIDTDNRQAMAEFLANHFRYYTMNSWNRLTSYANNVKSKNSSLPSLSLQGRVESQINRQILRTSL